jgi:hypothetical protein
MNRICVYEGARKCAFCYNETACYSKTCLNIFKNCTERGKF